VAAALALTSSVLITGGFHEDGLADSADGLGGAHGGKRALEIMKDSRLGTYGVLALVLGLLLRGTAMAELGPQYWFSLPLAHCWARLGPVWLLATQPYVSASTNTRQPLVGQAGALQASVATAWALVCGALGFATGWLSPTALYTCGLSLAGLTWLAARYFRRAVGGITGDLLGATEQVSEVACLLCLLIGRS
jgi:adenosylcobinamide-GDP ribazoletransferase